MNGVNTHSELLISNVKETYMIQKFAVFCRPANLHHACRNYQYFIKPYTFIDFKSTSD